ncbi:MAG: outer membrane beta-barrel protein [Bacteroidota bacterium]
MRNFLFYSALLISGFIVAQTDQPDRFVIEKGTWNVTGNVSLRSNSIDNEGESFSNANDFNSFSFNPLVGYALSNNFVVGLGLGYSRGVNEDANTDVDGVTTEFESETTTYSIFPYARKFFSVSPNFAFFLQGEARYNTISNESDRTFGDTVTNSSSEGDSWFFGIRPGVTYFVSKRFALEANLGTLGYTTSDTENSNSSGATTESDVSQFAFELNASNLLFGLSYYF